MKRLLLLSAGFLALALGTIGIFLPILPTTPFVLLAAACFIRSSRRFYLKLVSHIWFGPLIENYMTYRAVPRRTKVTALLMLWVLILISFFFFADAVWLRITLLAVAGGVTIHLSLLKTLTPEMVKEYQESSAVSEEGREK